MKVNLVRKVGKILDLGGKVLKFGQKGMNGEGNAGNF